MNSITQWVRLESTRGHNQLKSHFKFLISRVNLHIFTLFFTLCLENSAVITALTDFFLASSLLVLDKKKCHIFPNTKLAAAEKFSAAARLVVGKGGRAF